ncbi:M15 family metallopeptidase [Salinivibrio sp. ES.052]|uniref:M15 family metallopeptidase n=1 Tax=Salinivibrio sp. ES.052 TaxID=1882823 RepID=UPI00352EDA18
MRAAQLTGQDASALQPMNPRPNAPWLHQGVLEDLAALQQAATDAGFNLRVASGYRAFERQLAIWNGKFNGEKPVLDANSHPLDIIHLSESERVKAILRWSALPGASRHHWGTDMDVFDQNAIAPNQSLALTPHEYDSGPQAAFSSWLEDNVSAFGFFLPYAKDQGGVAREPWHISHITTSSIMLSAFSQNMLATAITHAPICGKHTILNQLDWIYSTYVTNLCEVE